MASSRVLFPEEMRIGEGRKRSEKFRDEWDGGVRWWDEKKRVEERSVMSWRADSNRKRLSAIMQVDISKLHNSTPPYWSTVYSLYCDMQYNTLILYYTRLNCVGLTIPYQIQSERGRALVPKRGSSNCWSNSALLYCTILEKQDSSNSLLLSTTLSFISDLIFVSFTAKADYSTSFHSHPSLFLISLISSLLSLFSFVILFLAYYFVYVCVLPHFRPFYSYFSHSHYRFFKSSSLPSSLSSPSFHHQTLHLLLLYFSLLTCIRYTHQPDICHQLQL